MSALLKHTPASEWSKSFVEGVSVQLPSGKTIVMRPVAMDVLMSKGKIPDLLTPLAAKTLWDVLPLDMMANDFKMASDLGRLMDIIIPAAVMEPKIYTGDGEVPEGSISIEWISLYDKVAIFQVAIQPVQVLDSFRDKQIGNVESLPDEQDDGDESITDSGDDGQVV